MMSVDSDAGDEVAGEMERGRGRVMLMVLPFLWLLIFCLFPLACMLMVSLSDTATTYPPYTPVVTPGGGWEGLTTLWRQFDFEHYISLLQDDIYWKSYLSSLKIAGLSTLITLLIGYPMAYGIAKTSPRLRSVLLIWLLLPLLTSVLVRVYAWVVILNHEDVLNHIFMGIRVIDAPLKLLHTESAVYIGIVYTYLPLMVLSLYYGLVTVGRTLPEAAMDLGCSRHHLRHHQ